MYRERKGQPRVFTRDVTQHRKDSGKDAHLLQVVAVGEIPARFKQKHHDGTPVSKMHHATC